MSFCSYVRYVRIVYVGGDVDIQRFQVIEVNTTLSILIAPNTAERADIAHPIARILRDRHLPIRIEVYRLVSS